jgi:hypothetical protein
VSFVKQLNKQTHDFLDKIEAVAIGRTEMQVDGSRADSEGKAKTGLTG